MSDSGKPIELYNFLRIANLHYLEDAEKYPILLFQQRGSRIMEIGPGVVSKKGRRVTRNEAAALTLVKESNGYSSS